MPLPDPDDQRRCIRCGYSLRGLLVGSACPECGLKIHGATSKDAPLDQASKQIVYGVAWRFSVAAGLVVVAIPAVAIVAALSFNRWGLGFLVSLAIVGPVVSWLLTTSWEDPSAVFNGLGPTSRVRRIVRFCGPAWALAGGMSVWLWFNGSATNPVLPGLRILGDVIIVIGLGQVMLLGVLMDRMGRWMRDEGGQTASGFLLFGAGIVLVGTLVGAIIKVVYNPVAHLLESVSTLLILAVLLTAAFLIARYARNALLSVVHMHHNHAVAERSAERSEAHEREMADRSAGSDAGGESERR